MRIDLLFKNMLIFKKRNTVKTLCQNNLIKVNDRIIKPSKKIREGDVVEIETPSGVRKIKVLKIPKRSLNGAERSPDRVVAPTSEKGSNRYRWLRA